MSAYAQAASVNASAVVTWTLPTTDAAGNPLTGTNALTKNQVFLSTSPIADSDTSIAPANEGTASATTISVSKTVPAGSTLYVRVKSCNASGCSPFSAQATKVLPAIPNTVPGAPGAVNVLVTVQVAPSTP
jgi:hypothetical protein